MMRHTNDAIEATGRQASNQIDRSNGVSRRAVLRAGALALTATMVAGGIDAAMARSASSSSSASAQTPAGEFPMVTVNAVTHLNFRGDAHAALGFYQSVFGGELLIISNEDMGIVDVPSELDQVKWGQVTAENGFKVMAYDVPAAQRWDRGQDSFFVSLRGDEADEVAELWEKLSEGAAVLVSLAPAQWAPLYGMLTDQFGITWVVDVVAAYPAA